MARTEIKGGHGAAIGLAAGQALSIINTHGTQVVDFWVVDPKDSRVFFSVEHTRRMLSRLFLEVGDSLYSNRREPLLRLEEDSWGGDHDMLCACCDPWLYEHLGHEGYHRSCRENFITAMAEAGLEVEAVPNPLNLWMNVPISEDRKMELKRPESRPGDHVLMRALADVVVILSACPMDISPVNGGDGAPKPVHYEILT